MTSSGGTPDPLEVVARALERPQDGLSDESAMYRDHGWDSFGHVSIIVAIEDVLNVNIEDEEVWELTTMKAIREFFDHCSRTIGNR